MTLRVMGYSPTFTFTYYLVHVLTLCETKLDNTILDSEVNIPGYRVIRKDRTRSGGGVAIYISSSLRFTHCITDSNLECLAINIINLSGSNITVATAYRPPSSKISYYDDLEHFIEQLDPYNKTLILTGDLNCDFIDPDFNTKHLIHVTEGFNLKQLVVEATRITQYSSTLIDVIFTNNESIHIETKVDSIALSDHEFVITILNTKAPPCNHHNQVTFRSYFNANSFVDDLRRAPFQEIRKSDNVNDAYTIFYDVLLKVCDKHAKLVTRRFPSSKLPPWLDKRDDILDLMHKRDRARARAKRSSDPEN